MAQWNGLGPQATLRLSSVRDGLPTREQANPGVNRSAKQHCCLVPAALRAAAPGYAERYAP